MSGGQRASDYVLEPCVAMPEITAAPDQRDWGQPVDGIGVLSEKGMWEARAKAARQAAAELKNCLTLTTPIMKVNYLGTGCSEGESLRSSLLRALGEDSGWASQLVSQIQALENLATNCERSALEIAAADSQSGQKLQGE